MLRFLILQIAESGGSCQLLPHPFGITGHVRILRTGDRHLGQRRRAEAEDLADEIARIEGEVRELAGPEVQDREVVRWAGKKLTFAALARMHGMEDDYLAVYKDFSWDTHGTLALFHSTRRTPEGAMVLRDAFDLQDTRFVALAAGRWALEILHLVAAAWQTTTRGDALGTRLVRAAEETVNPSLPEWSEWMALVREKEGPASASP